MCHYDGKHKGFLRGAGTTLFPVCGGGYANEHVLTFVDPFTKKKKKE